MLRSCADFFDLLLFCCGAWGVETEVAPPTAGAVNTTTTTTVTTGEAGEEEEKKEEEKGEKGEEKGE